MAPKRSGNGSYSGPGGLKHPGMAPAQGGPHPPIISNSISNPIIGILGKGGNYSDRKMTRVKIRKHYFRASF